MRPKNLEKEQAIKELALKIISEEGLENLSMQKLAQAAGISPRTIYLKYENKEDLLVKLFIEEVLGAYEQALLARFSETMEFAEGIKALWTAGFGFFKRNRSAYVLMQYGKSSPLLNKAFREKDIKQGQYFAPVHRFLSVHTRNGTIRKLPFEAQRAILFAPLFDLVNEYFEYSERPRQVITERVLMECCDAVIKGMLLR